MNKTNISWADYTLNPLYKRVTKILGRVAHGKPYKNIAFDDMMLDYKALNKLQANIKNPKGVFLCSMTDWAAVSEFVRMEWAIDILQACATSKYTCYLLTKRAENLPEILRQWQIKHRVSEWPSNVWLGFTAENQEWFDKRWVSFTDTDGVLSRFSDVNIFVSYEPALGSLLLPYKFYSDVTVGQFDGDKMLINYKKYKANRWIIAGGESGNNARPPHPWDFVQIKNQCIENGVGFHFKRWGTWRPSFCEPEYYKLRLAPGRYMKKAPRAEGNDLLFGQKYNWTPLEEN